MNENTVDQLQIRVERALCDALGREWAPAGFSIKTLCDEVGQLYEAAEQVYSSWACGEDWSREMRELGRALGMTSDPA